MADQRWYFVGFTSIFAGIIFFCVIAGGYTSFWRSTKRIEESKSFLTTACRKRMDLIPRLVKIDDNTAIDAALPNIEQIARKADTVLKLMVSKKTPIEKALIKEFEISQAKLTFQLKDLFNRIQASSDKKNPAQFSALKNQLTDAQNELFVTEVSYNDEVSYFNTRKSAFFTSFLAKLLGFSKLDYIPLPKDLFLPAKDTFGPSIS